MDIPTNSRVPFMFAKFDGSQAQQGSTALRYKILLIGNMISTGTYKGTKDPLTIQKITNKDHGWQFFGRGSVLAGMVEKFVKNNPLTLIEAVGISDDDAGVAATGTLTVTGPATAAGVISLYIGGRKVSVAVAKDDAAIAIAAAIVTAVNADTFNVCSAANVDEVITFTSKNKGLHGNQISIDYNLQREELLPAGVGLAVVAMANGAQNPDVGDVLALIGDEWYQQYVHPFSDADNLTALDVHLDDAFGPIAQKTAVHISVSKLTYAAQGAFGESRNSKYGIIIDYVGVSNPWDVAAAISARSAGVAENDPALPIQNIPLVDIYAPRVEERRTYTERNNLLYSGISTLKIAAGNVVQIERLITGYRLNDAGASDEAYLRYETITTITYIRFDWVSKLYRKYPQHKLASDGVRLNSGQKVMTPSLGRAEALDSGRAWEGLGLVENMDAFKASLVVERDANDPDRLNWFFFPDLVNQFRIGGTTFAFLL